MKKNWKKRAAALVLSAAMAGQPMLASVMPTLTVTAAENAGNTTDQAVTADSVIGFEKDAMIQLTKTAGTTIGASNADGGVAEIVAYNSDNKKAYVVNGQEAKLNILPMKEDGSFDEEKKEAIEIRGLIDGFAYGDMTSVAIDTVNDRLAVAIQAEDYTAKGRIAILDYEGNLQKHYEAGVQPDMVTFTKDGSKVLTANEGEPRKGYGADTVDPKGSVTVVDLSKEKATTVGFEGYNSEELAKEGILFNKVEGKILSAENDLEPEYIGVTDDGSKAYISLQEANAIAVLDMATLKITDVKSVGFQDYSKEENAVDLDRNDAEGYTPKTYENTLGVRMPDGISIYQREGKTYILTANEGDGREWGEEGTSNYFTNEAETKLTATDGTETSKKVTLLDRDKTAGLEDGKNYLFGSRSFSILDADTMQVVYDSANGFEKNTAKYLPDYFNCSNDSVEADKRSNKKGPEPESVTVGAVDGKTYAFVALERIGGVMVYDITDPAKAAFVNYINSRDFSSDMSGDDSPEGLAFIPANDSANELPMVLAACEVSGTVAGYSITGDGAKEAVVLYTNDVHCAIGGYSSLAAYSEAMTEEGYRNILVDAGDAIQGDTIGAITKGEAIVNLMNQTGYELAVPGNHEFDYKMDTFLKLAQKEAAYDYISANFKELAGNKTVFDGYRIKNAGGRKIAFVGISTPETYTKSSPAYFQDENGAYIYSFCEGDAFYQTIQESVDAARAAGAEYVVAVGHTGIEGTTEEWKSTSIIANTTGIDVYLDAHSHETIESAAYENKDGKNVVLSSTGTKFANIGKLVIKADGTISTELLETSKVDHESSTGVKIAYNKVQSTIDTYNTQIEEELGKKIGTSEVELTVNDAEGIRRIRNGETNMGDFVADAYKTVTGADIALVNGGGIRASIPAGDVTKKLLMTVNPWNNAMCTIKATGQQIMDALEHGARNYPDECGGFLQVAGLTYEIDRSVESPVITDSKGMFEKIDASKERRVKNVKAAGNAIDPNKTYVVVGSRYTLLEGGDGFTMFQKNEVVQSEDLSADAEMLIDYFIHDLKGTVTKARYGNASGDGRIKVVSGGAVPTETPAATKGPGETAAPAASAAPTQTNIPKDDGPVASPPVKVTVKRAVIASARNVKGRKIRIIMKKPSGVKGFRVKYVAGTKFKAKKVKTVFATSKKIVLRKLKKGKVYSLKVCAYKKNSAGKKVYGAYSKVKRVKVTK